MHFWNPEAKLSLLSQTPWLPSSTSSLYILNKTVCVVCCGVKNQLNFLGVRDRFFRLKIFGGGGGKNFLGGNYNKLGLHQIFCHDLQSVPGVYIPKPKPGSAGTTICYTNG